MSRAAASRVRFLSGLRPAVLERGFVHVAFYDQSLARRVPQLRSWLERFDLAIPLRAGEGLKSAAMISSVVGRLLSAGTSYPRGRTRFYAVGGGSIGDFTGFLASVFLRGVELVHVPTTWVSAMDSAHGGKTALNAAGVKNVLGTFHPAVETWIIRDFFRAQDGERLEEALGEAAKMALLDWRVWKASRSGSKASSRWTPARMWKLLPEIIRAKLRVVARDPRETRGTRRILNLGHTLGHAIEARHGVPHGRAVGVGLYFSLWVSWCEGVIPTSDFFALEHALTRNWGLSLAGLHRLRIPRARIAPLLVADKKAAGSGRVHFIALRGAARPVQLQLGIRELLDHLDGFWNEC